jgi:predicted phage baseplate assembly protein
MAEICVSAVGLTQPVATDVRGEATIDLPGNRREFRLRCECLGASIDVAIRNCPVDAEAGLRVTLPIRVDVVLGESDVAVPVLAFQPARGDRHALVTLPIVSLGVGTGRPGDVAKLPVAPVSGGRFELLTREPAGWRRWERRPDFLASRRVDAHFVLDPSGGSVQFGDGERGRVVPAGAPLIAISTATDGAAGNLAAGTIATVPETLLNRLTIPGFPETAGRIASVRNGLPATGGSSGETLDEAAARAFRDVRRSDRAVTIADYERLALETPGTHLARVKARANRHPDFPCIANAVGVMTVIVVPFLPAERPEPSPATLYAVAVWLQTRRLLGSRVEVVGPTYVPLRVRARVRAYSGSDPAALAARIRKALNNFLHPLRGGSDGRGWPFGRDVYRSEVLQVIDETRGTDHVLFLEFLGADDRPRCGNVCVPETGLVSAGLHEIEVVRGDP